MTLRIHDVAYKRRATLLLLILLSYGAFDELTQPLVNRHCSLFDWLADAAGICITVLADGLSTWRKNHRPMTSSKLTREKRSDKF